MPRLRLFEPRRLLSSPAVVTRFSGHAWTIGAALLGPLRHPAPDGETAWSVDITDDKLGRVTLRGHLRPSTTDDLVVIVHGLGGTADSPYVRQAAQAAVARGCATLRVNMRGAAGDGEDVYHAGLASDLAAVIESASLQRYANVYVLGYSLGGHLALRLGCEPPDRVRAIAAVGSPLDLAASCRVIDRRRAWPYRNWILRALRGSYRTVHARGRGLADPRAVAGVRRLRDWDERVVVVRHDFADVDDYYARASVGTRLRELAVPAALTPSLDRAGHDVHARWLSRGGHVGYPSRAYDGRGVEDVLLDWFADPDRPPAPVI